MIFPKNVHDVNVRKLCVLFPKAEIGILLDQEGDARRCLQSNERHKDRFVYGCSCSNHQGINIPRQNKNDTPLIISICQNPRPRENNKLYILFAGSYLAYKP